jgi:hypothetical protein
MRTISEPARAKAATCFAVPSTSAVSVLVIDCTTTGAPPPTVTLPTLTATVRCLAVGPENSIMGSVPYVTLRGGLQPAGKIGRPEPVAYSVSAAG